MATYEERAQAALKNKSVRTLNAKFWKWDKDGKTLVGTVLRIDTVETKKDWKPIKRYVLDTDYGIRSCLLGGASDTNLDGFIRVGMTVMITYDGTMEMDNGRNPMNVFTVLELPDEQ